MSTPLIGHMDPEFMRIMDEVKSMLCSLLHTENRLTLPISGAGSAGMEACLVNLLEPGDRAVICVHGVFGNRMCDIAERCGATVDRVEAEWGQPIEPGRVEAALGGNSPKLVAVVHAETSTGVWQPLEEISAMTHEAGALFVVDAVTSLAGVDVQVDSWRIDALYSGTQKCLSAPPGLSPITFSDRAVEAFSKRKSKVQSWYLDLNLINNYWDGDRAYHHTAPISSVYALHEALRIVLEEGLQARFQRHLQQHELLKQGLEKLGFEFVVDAEYRLPMLNAVRLPAGVDEAWLRSRLLTEYNIEIGAGLGAFKGKVWRIGLMGASCTRTHVNTLLAALRTELNA